MPPRNDRIEPMTPPQRAVIAPRKGTLASIVGIAGAGLLLTLTPREESGRTVAVTVQQDGTATVRHVAGKQYLRAYLDIAKVATICDGLTRGVRLGQQATEEQCAAKLDAELVQKAIEVKACTPSLWRPGTDNQRVAAIMLAYNIGSAAFCRSTAHRLFEAGQFRAACDAFLPWDKARVNGVLRPVKGLIDRRRRERAVCLTGL